MSGKAGPDGTVVIFSTARSVFGGETDLGGIRTAALNDVALITQVSPDPIVVSAGDQVLTDVEVAYRLIPADPDVATAEVHVDVRAGGRIATLPGPVVAGSGTTTWERGTVVNLTKVYEARVSAQRDGAEMPGPPRRLRFDKIPLAITTKDRALRVQFAVPRTALVQRADPRCPCVPHGTRPAVPGRALVQDLVRRYPERP